MAPRRCRRRRHDGHDPPTWPSSGRLGSRYGARAWRLESPCHPCLARRHLEWESDVNCRTLGAALTFALLVATACIQVAAPQAVAAPNALAGGCITSQLTLAPALSRSPDTNPDGS